MFMTYCPRGAARQGESPGFSWLAFPFLAELWPEPRKGKNSGHHVPKMSV